MKNNTAIETIMMLRAYNWKTEIPDEEWKVRFKWNKYINWKNLFELYIFPVWEENS